MWMRRSRTSHAHPNHAGQMPDVGIPERISCAPAANLGLPKEIPTIVVMNAFMTNTAIQSKFVCQKKGPRKTELLLQGPRKSETVTPY